MFSGAQLVPQGAKSPRHSTRCCLGPCAHRHQLGGQSFVSSLPSGAAVPPSPCTRLRCSHSLCRLPSHLIPSPCHLIPFPSPLPCKASHPQLSSSSHFPPTREAPLFCPNRSPAFQPLLSNVAMPGVASSKQAGTNQALEHPNFYVHPNLSPVSVLAPPKRCSITCHHLSITLDSSCWGKGSQYCGNRKVPPDTGSGGWEVEGQVLCWSKGCQVSIGQGGSS